jgi:hypothetical protein
MGKDGSLKKQNQKGRQTKGIIKPIFEWEE